MSANSTLYLFKDGSHQSNAQRDIFNVQIDNIFVGIQNNFSFNAEYVGKAFVKSIVCGLEDYYEKILDLQRFKGSIPAGNHGGLGHALLEAVNNSDGTALSLIEKQPNYNDVPAVDRGIGLNFCLLECIRKLYGDLENPTYLMFLKSIVHHHNARLIDDVEILDLNFDPLARIKAIAQGNHQILNLINEFEQLRGNV